MPSENDNIESDLSDQEIIQLQLLAKVHKAVVSSYANLDKALATILDVALKALHADHGQIFILEGNELVVSATTTEPAEKELDERLHVEDSVAGLAVERKDTIIIDDVEKEPRYKRMLDAEYIQSEIAVPLIQDGRVFGVLNIESPVLNAFSKRDKEMLETLAGQAAIAIKNARLYEELNTLREIDKAILNSALDLDSVLGIILSGVLHLRNANHGQIFILEGNELMVRATTTEPAEKELGTRLHVDNSVSGLAVQKKDTIIIDDVSKEPRYKRMLDAEYIQSEIAVPLIQDGRVFGVLNIESPVLNAFSKRDKEMLETLAGQAAIAIKNARLYEELNTLREIDKAILNSALDLDSVLGIILSGVLHLRNANHGQIFILEGNELMVRATTTEPAEKELGTRLHVDNSVSGLAVQKKDTIIIDDVSKEPRYKRMLDAEYIQSEIAVPLIQDGRVFGVLNIESPVLNAFSKRDKEMLETLAGQVAIAIIRTQNQEELRQTKMIKAVGETASWLVHKIGNVAFNIEYSTNSLRDEIDPTNASALEDLNMIERALRRIVEMKRILLKPLQPVHLEPIQFKKILDSTILEAGIPSNMIDISLDTDLPEIKADRACLSDVFMELLHNALDALQEIADKKIEIRAYVCPDKDCVEIKFTDNGIGITPEILDEIWAIGFTTKQEQSGTGLGLYTVAQELIKMDAKIFVDSTINVGTTFTIRIPIWEAKQHNNSENNKLKI